MDPLWLPAAIAMLGAASFTAATVTSEAVLGLAQSGWQGYADWIGGELRAVQSTTPVRAFFVRHLLLVAAAIGLGLALATPAKAALLALAALFAPLIWFKRARQLRQAQLNLQLDPGLQLMANAVLATQNLADGFDALARHGSPPLAYEAGLLVKELRVGASMDEAMRDLALRCQNPNVDAVITALSIGRRTGGNLPKVLEVISRVVRETLRVEGLIASKTAEGKASGLVMAALPLVFMMAMSVIDPSWMAPLYNDVIGNCILALIIIFTIAGALLIRKVSTIDV